jgi:hypothetical protein
MAMPRLILSSGKAVPLFPFQRGVRTSLENFKQYEDIEVYPLYAVGNLVRGQRI